MKSCCVWWWAGQAWWPLERRGRRPGWGVLTAQGAAAVAGLKGPLFPGSAGRALMEAQGVYLSLFAERFLKGAGIGIGVSSPGPRPPLKPLASDAKKTSATKLLPYY